MKKGLKCIEADDGGRRSVSLNKLHCENGYLVFPVISFTIKGKKIIKMVMSP